MKYTIYIVMLLLMINTAFAVFPIDINTRFSDGNFEYKTNSRINVNSINMSGGEFYLDQKPFCDSGYKSFFTTDRNCPVAPSVPGVTVSPGGTGLTCGTGELLFFGLCVPNIFEQLSALWNQSTTFKWFAITGGVLEYRLEIEGETNAGQSFTINNIITNEGDTPVEMSCTNFLDIDNNGRQSRDDILVNFNKQLGLNETVIINTTIFIPLETKDGRYFVGGECDLLNSDQPNANAFTTIQIGEVVISVIPKVSDGKIFTVFNIIMAVTVLLSLIILIRIGFIQLLFQQSLRLLFAVLMSVQIVGSSGIFLFIILFIALVAYIIFRLGIF